MPLGKEGGPERTRGKTVGVERAGFVSLRMALVAASCSSAPPPLDALLLINDDLEVCQILGIFAYF
jgi:hypothetical protein